MTDPRKLLNKTLKAIDHDVKEIVKSQSRDGKAKKLDPVDALTLTRYVACLLNISEERDKDDEKERKRLSRLSDDELTKMAKEAILQSEQKKKSNDRGPV